MENSSHHASTKLIAGAFLMLAALRGFMYYKHRALDELFFIAGMLLMSFAVLLNGGLLSPTGSTKIANAAGYAGFTFLLIGLAVLVTQ